MLRNVPKSTLLIIGGAEDKGSQSELAIAGRNKDFKHFEILKEMLPKKKSNETIEIITTASHVPEVIAAMYKKAFSELHYKKVDFMYLVNHKDAKNPDYIKRIGKAHTVLFGGGDQYRLSTILGNTEILDAIHDRYFNDKNFVVAGSSAGAMALSTLVMFEGESNEALLKGTVKISSGLGFIDGCLIDTHFAKRGRFGRLAQATVMNPTCIGFGIGEDTALMIKKGNIAECIGSGMVLVLDGKEIKHTNIFYAQDSTPVCIENLIVHILKKGNKYILNERKFLAAKEDLKIESEHVKKLKKETKIGKIPKSKIKKKAAKKTKK